jgi:hypothetical protein
VHPQSGGRREAAGAKGALILMDDGPTGLGQDWDGYDMPLLVNLTDEAPNDPRLGVGRQGYLLDTLAGGCRAAPETAAAR